jgi:hypothetical protein
MKKNFYTTIIAVIFLGFITASCHKENLQPSKSVKEQGASSSAVAAGGGTSSQTPVYPSDGNHSTCPASGGHH